MVMFHRWSRKNYAVFGSLGKTIKVCSLGLSCALVAIPGKTKAQQQDTTSVTDRMDLQEVVVTAERTPSLLTQTAKMVIVLTADDLGQRPFASVDQALRSSGSADVRQRGDAYPFVATVEIATAKGRTLERLEVKGSETSATFRVAEKPLRVTLNAGHEVPVASMPPATLPNLLDAWEKLLFVPGTSREVEANRSLATAFRDQVADTFTEVLPELRADAEVTEQELRERDLVLFGGIESNALLARMAREHALPVAFGDGFFRFQGRLYAAPDDGVAFAMPNPWNPRRTVYVFSANTRTQLWRMTRSYPRGLAGWALWKGAEVASKGFHESPGLTVTLE